MNITRTHALYWAQHRLPAALRARAQTVTIDQVISANAGEKPPISTDLYNTMSILRTKAKYGDGEHIAWLLDRASWAFPGEGIADELGRRTHPDKRTAICRRWAKKLRKGRNP